jgi:hypothetical protein
VKNNQQYLAKNPFDYRCHSNTGVKFPAWHCRIRLTPFVA